MAFPTTPDTPLRADERTTLLAFLDFYRATLLDQVFGLEHSQLQVALEPSSLTLARLLGHMALVEQSWFQVRFDGQDEAEPWASLDFEADYDAEMTMAQTWSVEQLLAQFETAVVDSRATVAAADSLDQLSQQPNANGEYWSLRWILVHMIEEYARHCGHADFIRESIDANLGD